MEVKFFKCDLCGMESARRDSFTKHVQQKCKKMKKAQKKVDEQSEIFIIKHFNKILDYWSCTTDDDPAKMIPFNFVKLVSNGVKTSNI